MTKEIDPRNPEVFLLMGQSNMAGRGVIEMGDDEPVDDVYVLDGQCRLDDLEPVQPIRWRAGAHPLHLNEPQKNQFGMGMDFARRYLELNPAVTVGLIPCAWGGQPIDVLGLGSPLFVNAVKRAAFAAESGTVRGVLWHQGESDTASARSARDYAAKLRTVITELRAELGTELLFVIGDLAPTLGETRDSEARANIATVRYQLQAVAESTPRVGWVSSSSLNTAEDGTHFTREALREFGRRYAETTHELRQAS